MAKQKEYLIYRTLAALSGLVALGILILGFKAAMASHFWQFTGFTMAFAIANAAYVAADHKAVVAQKFWSEPLSAAAFASLCDASSGLKYGLYLRPNRMDAQVRIYQTLNPFQLIAFNIGMPFIEIQEWFLRCAEPHWRFLSQGGLTTNIRPTELLSSELRWFDDILLASEKISVFLILPGATPGVMHELDYFLTHRPHNVILIAPPRRGNEIYFSSIGQSPSPIFELVRQAPDAGALILPERTNDGQWHFHYYELTKRNLRRVLAARALPKHTQPPQDAIA